MSSDPMMLEARIRELEAENQRLQQPLHAMMHGYCCRRVEVLEAELSRLKKLFGAEGS